MAAKQNRTCIQAAGAGRVEVYPDKTIVDFYRSEHPMDLTLAAKDSAKDNGAFSPKRRSYFLKK